MRLKDHLTMLHGFTSDKPVPEYCYVVAEIGINHNGDLGRALELISSAKESGCDAVKFQKRTPSLSTPHALRNSRRDTPWGNMTYLDYKERIEFELKEYQAIDIHARELGIEWSASAWDSVSLEFLDQFDLPFHKVASALATSKAFVREVAARGKPTLLSTGFASWSDIDEIVEIFNKAACPLVLLHSVGQYPCPPDQLNLSMITTLRSRYSVPVGYSGHEAGVSPSLTAANLGAVVIERHFTRSRADWGTDQAASLEANGMRTLVGGIRLLRTSLGDGRRSITDEAQEKLRSLTPPPEAFTA